MVQQKNQSLRLSRYQCRKPCVGHGSQRAFRQPASQRHEPEGKRLKGRHRRSPQSRGRLETCRQWPQTPTAAPQNQRTPVRGERGYPRSGCAVLVVSGQCALRTICLPEEEGLQRAAKTEMIWSIPLVFGCANGLGPSPIAFLPTCSYARQAPYPQLPAISYGCSSRCRYDIITTSLFQEKNSPISLCDEPLCCNDCCVSNKTAYAPSLQIGGLV